MLRSKSETRRVPACARCSSYRSKAVGPSVDHLSFTLRPSFSKFNDLAGGLPRALNSRLRTCSLNLGNWPGHGCRCRFLSIGTCFPSIYPFFGQDAPLPRIHFQPVRLFTPSPVLAIRKPVQWPYRMGLPGSSLLRDSCCSGALLSTSPVRLEFQQPRRVQTVVSWSAPSDNYL